MSGPVYLKKIPANSADISAGKIVVHNHVRPTRQLGERGFRAWLDDATAPDREPCDCGWAPELGQHYRVRLLAKGRA